MASKAATKLTLRFPKADIETVLQLEHKGLTIIGCNTEVASRVSGLDPEDLFLAIVRGQIAGRCLNGKIIVLYDSLRDFVLGLESAEPRNPRASPRPT